jgi:hypothetical protein
VVLETVAAPSRILPAVTDIFVSCSRCDKARDAADRGVLVPVRLDNARLPVDFRSIPATELDGWEGGLESAPFIACAISALQETGVAVEPLAGISPKLSAGMATWLQAHTDLDPIREDARFMSLMEGVKARLAGA